jgi:hypothetical protein
MYNYDDKRPLFRFFACTSGFILKFIVPGTLSKRSAIIVIFLRDVKEFHLMSLADGSYGGSNLLIESLWWKP